MSVLYFDPISAPADTAFDVPIVLDTEGMNVASLQFDLSIPAGYTVVSVSKGPASISAGKEVNTNMVEGKQRLLIFGLNQNTFQNGVIAVIRLLSNLVKTDTFTFTNLVASDPDANAVVITGRDGQITILGGLMATEAELDAALTTVSDGLTALTAAVTELVNQVNALIAKIQANPAVDLTDEIATLQNVAAAISTNAVSIQSAIDAAKQITEPPAG